MRNYKIGFSFAGIIAVILIMIPNMLFLFITPSIDNLSSNEARFWLWNILENIGRFGMMISLCVITNKNGKRQNRVLDFTAIFLLLVYYVLWIAYFKGIQGGLGLVGMALFPSVFFLLISWKLKNMFAFSFSLVFAITHIAITSSNFLF